MMVQCCYCVHSGKVTIPPLEDGLVRELWSHKEGNKPKTVWLSKRVMVLEGSRPYILALYPNSFPVPSMHLMNKQQCDCSCSILGRGNRQKPELPPLQDSVRSLLRSLLVPISGV